MTDVAELRAALAPFAALAAVIDKKAKDDAPWCGQPPVIVRHADIRRAGAALSGATWNGSQDDLYLIHEASQRAIEITLKDQVTCSLLQRLAAALSARGTPKADEAT